MILNFSLNLHETHNFHERIKPSTPKNKHEANQAINLNKSSTKSQGKLEKKDEVNSRVGADERSKQ